MLPVKYRLKKRKAFNYIYKNGRRTGGAFISVVYCQTKTPNVKAGFSANKKVGNSIIRHRAVRLMREAVKSLLPRMAANNYYIFVAKEKITEQHLLFITLDIEKALTKAGLLK